MIINTKITVGLSVEEKWVLDKASSLAIDIANSLPELGCIVSPTTGELIDIEELRRVAGVLSGLANNMHWEIVK